MLNWLELRSASSRSLQISEACQRSCPLLVFVPFRRLEDAQVFQPRWTISAAGCPPSRAAFCFSHSCADAILFYVSDLWTYKLTAHNTPHPTPTAAQFLPYACSSSRPSSSKIPARPMRLHVDVAAATGGLAAPYPSTKGLCPPERDHNRLPAPIASQLYSH